MKLTTWFFLSAIFVFSTSQAGEDHDISSQPESLKNVENLGLPTISYVDSLKKKASNLFFSDDCKSAVVALNKYAKAANHLANIIAAGLKPFYDSNYNERQEYGIMAGLLVPYEAKANELRKERNRAKVQQAECLVKLGQPEEGAAMFIEALELIQLDDDAWWGRARSGLYSLIELE